MSVDGGWDFGNHYDDNYNMKVSDITLSTWNHILNSTFLNGINELGLSNCQTERFNLLKLD